MYSNKLTLTVYLYLNKQTQLLDEHLKDLRRTLKSGHKRLNWNSLGITDYITRCEQVGTIKITCEVAAEYSVSSSSSFSRRNRDSIHTTNGGVYSSSCLDGL